MSETTLLYLAVPIAIVLVLAEFYHQLRWRWLMRQYRRDNAEND